MNDIHDLLTGAEDLGEIAEIEVVERLVPLAGLTVVDVGCGGGRVTKELAARAAVAIGVEPDPIQAEKNRAAEPQPGLSFIEAPGQALPFDDGSIDGVFFSYSMHHVPREHMAGALAEAVRALKPETGFLYVLEPLLSGSMEAVYRPFHDETEVRTLAYEAVQSHAAPRFAQAREVWYREPVRYDSYAEFVDGIVGTTYSDFGRTMVDTPGVRAAFEAGRTGDGFVFTQHARVNLFHGPKP